MRKAHVFVGIAALIIVVVLGRIPRDSATATTKTPQLLVDRAGRNSSESSATPPAATMMPAVAPIAAPTALTHLVYGRDWHNQTEPALVMFRRWTELYEQTSSITERDKLVLEGQKLAEARRSVMRALIERDPEAAFGATVPMLLRTKLPEPVMKHIESIVSGRGELSLLCATADPTTSSQESSLFQTAHVNGATYRAHAYGRRAHMMTKYGASIHGLALDGHLAVHDSPIRLVNVSSAPENITIEMFGESRVLTSVDEILTMEHTAIAEESGAGPHVPSGQVKEPSSAAATSWSTGLKRVLVIRVDFEDLRGEPVAGNEPLTEAKAQAWMDDRIRPFFEVMSYHKTTLLTTVTTKVYRLAASSSIQGAFDLMSNAESLAGADYPLGQFDRVVVVFSSLAKLQPSGFPWSGMSEIGGRHSWLNGNFGPVVAHELGHTFGLPHAHSWETTDGDPASPLGTRNEYGDVFDIMGSGPSAYPLTNANLPHVNPCFKSSIGWLDDTQIQSVSTSGRYRVYRFDDSEATGVVALKVRKNAKRDYWISNRRSLDNESLAHGGYVLWGPTTISEGTFLLDATPLTKPVPGAAAAAADVALGIGKALADQEAQILVRVVSEGGTPPRQYLDVDISFGPAPPVINIEPPNTISTPGAAATFSVSAVAIPPPSYRWQRLAVTTSSWSDVGPSAEFSGADSSTLRINRGTSLMDGDQYRCVITNAAGTVTTRTATLSLMPYGVSTFAGVPGVAGKSDGSARDAQFHCPTRCVFDRAGNLYVTDCNSNIVRKITAGGLVTTLAGTAPTVITKGAISLENRGSRDGTGGVAQFRFPRQIALDRDGNLLVGDTLNYTIRKVTPGGVVTTIAGAAGVSAHVDGPTGQARFRAIAGLIADQAGNIYVSDASSIRKITVDGMVMTLAGSPTLSGNLDGKGQDARFNSPGALILDRVGNLLVAADGIRKITPDGVVKTMISSPALGAGGVISMVLAADDAVYFSAQGTQDTPHDIKRIAPDWREVTNITGHQRGFADGPLDSAQFDFTSSGGMAFDGSGNLFAADGFNSVIRKCVIPPWPLIQAEPKSQTLVAGQSAVLAITVTNPSTLAFQWMKNGATIAGATNSTFTLPVIKLEDAGEYSVRINNYGVVTVSSVATVTVNVPPEIVAPPQSQEVAFRSAVEFAVRASGAPTPTFQWQFNGQPIPGATNDRMRIDSVIPENVGTYNVVVSNIAGHAISGAAELALSNGGRLTNLSILTTLRADDPPLTIGTVIGGDRTSGTKAILVRAAGPSLAQLGVAPVLPDPKVELFSGESLIAENDNWGGAEALSMAFARLGAFAYTSAQSKDSGILRPSILPGAYTIRVSGTSNGNGFVLAELYDAALAEEIRSTMPRFINVSVLQNISVNEELTVGFVVAGATEKKVLIRAIGPSLAMRPFGLAGAMTDPMIELFSGSTLLSANDDWSGAEYLGSAFTDVGAFSLSPASRDAALLITLVPGSYTARVRGVGGAHGVTLVEVYEAR